MPESEILQGIIDLARDVSAEDNIAPETRLVQDLRLIGDDMDEFLEAIVERYGTDFSAFVWHRHYPDEYSAPYFLVGRFFRYLFRLPQVEYEPITIGQIAKAVTHGRWEYDHPLPEERTPSVSPWLHTVAYGLTVAPILLSILAAMFLDSDNESALWSTTVFYLLIAIVSLSPAAGLSISIRLYITDPPHRAPTLFLMIVHSLFLALVLFVFGATVLGY
jgi:hypothetical protein